VCSHLVTRSPCGAALLFAFSLVKHFFANEANALKVTVRNGLAENSSDDFTFSEVPLFPVSAVPDLRLGDGLPTLVEQLNSCEVALVVSSDTDRAYRRVQSQNGVLREILARPHFFRLLTISQFDLKLVIRGPSVVSEKSNTRDSGLLQLLLGGTHTSNVNEEAECVSFFVLVTWMGVVEND